MALRFGHVSPNKFLFGHSAHRRIRHPVESHRLGAVGRIHIRRADFAMGSGAVFRLNFPGRRARPCDSLRLQAHP